MFHSTRRLAVCAMATLVLTGTAATAGQKQAKAYAVHNLVSNGAVDTPYFDPNMVNTWGVSFNPNGMVWVTNNRTGTSTLYDGLGVPQSLVVNVPAGSGGGVGSPTGIVFSGTGDFVVSQDGKTGPSRFIFASNDGLISGWAPGVNLLNALPVAYNPNADYLGLAIATSAAGPRLYATDYRNGRVDIFNASFAKLDIAGAFVDPKLPAGLSPFGIQTIANQVYVTYVKKGGYNGTQGISAPAKSAESVVDIFDTDGKFIRRAIKSTEMREPWGIALAPADFGTFSNRLLVSDFHEGTIGAYDQTNGAFLGILNDKDGKALKVPGIWGIQFGNGLNNQPLNTLFFGAGPNGQGGGVYGSVTAGVK